MNRWLLRGIGALAFAALLLIAIEAGAAMRAGAWLAVPDLAALEVTVVVGLGIAALGLSARGRGAFRLEDAATPSWPRRLATLWGMSFASVLGALPGLALDLGPPAVWPLVLVVLFGLLGRRVVWLLCTSYGLAAAATLITVRHVF